MSACVKARSPGARWCARTDRHVCGEHSIGASTRRARGARGAPARGASACRRLFAEDEYFFAEQNAAIVANAEEYYRTMFGDRAGSWNQRDRHMADTLDQLLAHLDRHGGTARVLVWAHNSHVGDARSTEMAKRGELNIGQLLRERHGHDIVNVGFTTYTGTVTAASEWGGAAERKRVRAACPTATRRSCTPLECRPSCCARWPRATVAARFQSRAWSARSA